MRNWPIVILELTLHAGERWMRPIPDLDPVVAPATAVDALAVLRDQQPRECFPKGIRNDRSSQVLLVVAYRDRDNGMVPDSSSGILAGAVLMVRVR